MSWLRVAAGLSIRIARHPSLAGDLVRVAWRFRHRHWYRRFPFLPLPAREYVQWRIYTAYGDSNAIPTAKELERYARWAVRSP